MQKILLFLIISLLLLITACVPASFALSSSATSSPSATQTLTSQPTSTATALATATPEPSPTPAVENLYYPGVAPTIEEFDKYVVEQSQIKAIIADLRNKPALLDTNAPPFQHTKGGSDTDTSITLSCNYDGTSCAPVASGSVWEGETLMHVVIFEILNADNTRGYITAYLHDNIERPNLNKILYLTENPMGYYILKILESTTDANNTYASTFPTALKLTQQEGYVDYAETIFQTGIIPQDSEDMIMAVAMSW